MIVVDPANLSSAALYGHQMVRVDQYMVWNVPQRFLLYLTAAEQHEGANMHTLTKGQQELIKDDEFWRWLRAVDRYIPPFFRLMRKVEILKRIQAQPFY